jgi:hypothetical protein
VSCPDAKDFPLALKRESLMLDNDNENYFKYKQLSLSEKVLRSDVLIHDYTFRVNETSRLMIEVVSDLANSHLIAIVTSDEYDGTMAIHGKQ